MASQARPDGVRQGLVGQGEAGGVCLGAVSQNVNRLGMARQAWFDGVWYDMTRLGSVRQGRRGGAPVR